jgi:hypothetical protein
MEKRFKKIATNPETGRKNTIRYGQAGKAADGGEVCESEVTWSREKIFDHDVEYVHADEIRLALMGHRRSELWGDKGLIASTMRCVDAIGLIEDLVTTDHESKEAFIQRVRGILGHNATSPSVGANEK